MSIISKTVKTVALAASLIAGGAYAADYTPDTLLGSANLGNSGQDTEITALEGFAGVDLTFGFKLEQGDAGFNIQQDANGDWYINVDPNEPGYFVLKFGTGNLPNGFHDTYFFQNAYELTKLVFTAADVNFLIGGGDCPTRNGQGCGSGRLSHYTTTTGSSTGGGPGSGTVPEPSSSMLALLGLGLIGASLRSRRAGSR